MLLQKVREYAERHADELGPPMYIETPIRYEIELDDEGNAINIIPLTGEEGARKNRGLNIFAPNLVRSSGIRAKLLVDNAEYALGWVREGKDPERVARQHEAFVELVRQCAEMTADPDVEAILKFLEKPVDGRLERPDDFDANQNVTFSVFGEMPFRNPTVQRFWAEHTAGSGEDAGVEADCLVCGRHGPAVRLLPEKIKGVPGGQSSGTALVSTNNDSFRSYNLDDVSCAPICAACAELVCKGLNHLLATETSRVFVRPLVYAFWTREDTGFRAASMISNPEPQEVQALFQAVRSARQGATQLDPTQFYCVGLAGSGGRVAVRDWIDTSVATAQQSLARYFELQRLYSPFDDTREFYGLNALSRATLRTGAKGTDEPEATVPRALMRTALRRTPLPDWLLAQVIKRIRAEMRVSHTRAVLVKMVLASKRPDDMEDTLVGLNEENLDPGYLCGRLLAVLEAIQRAAIPNINATIVDRFFGTASSAPLTVFPRLVRGALPHLSKIGGNRPGTRHALETRMQGIVRDIGDFPRTLTLHQQGQFVLGYYHQRADDTKNRMERSAARKAADAAAAELVEQAD